MSLSQWKLIAQLREQLSEKGHVMHVIRREWVDLVKKLPSVSGQITATQSQDVTTKPSTEPSRVGQVLLESMQVLNELKSKFSQNTGPPLKPVSDAKWKRKPKAVSAESIVSRTNYLISSMESARSDESVVKRLEDFTNHLLEYPDAASLAVKNGVVRVLLRIRASSDVEDVREGAQGALALVGYVDPPVTKGIRILAIDGGGVRGLLVIEMLRRLEELTEKKVGKYVPNS